jgi:hypothetical protein
MQPGQQQTRADRGLKEHLMSLVYKTKAMTKAI